jgi:cytochrome c-type biogenesis protein CcmE
MGIRKRYLVGALVLVSAVGYLLYLSFGSSVSYYVTVSEFFDRGTEFYDIRIRVTGEVAGSPILWDPAKLELKFAITEGGDTMKVVYSGARPSGLEAGVSILAEGQYDSDGIFRATQLIMKCPSKYEPEE